MLASRPTWEGPITVAVRRRPSPGRYPRPGGAHSPLVRAESPVPRRRLQRKCARSGRPHRTLQVPGLLSRWRWLVQDPAGPWRRSGRYSSHHSQPSWSVSRISCTNSETIHCRVGKRRNVLRGNDRFRQDATDRFVERVRRGVSRWSEPRSWDWASSNVTLGPVVHGSARGQPPAVRSIPIRHSRAQGNHTVAPFRFWKGPVEFSMPGRR